MRDVFLAWYYQVFKKLNHKDRVENFVALPGESVSSSWDRFTAYMRGVPKHCIDDESLKEFFCRDKMIIIRQCLILLRVVLPVSVHM